MSNLQTNADQIAFWNGDAGQRWVQSQERLDAMLAGITTELMKTAAVKPGERVLDIGCGCGETSLLLAKSGAHVTGADISAPMLARAKHRAAETKTPNTEFVEADASSHRFPQAYDVLLSRFGVMFFADPDSAFANMHKALKPGGRVAFVCWQEPRANEWVRVPIGAIRPHVPPQAPNGPEDPGPFAFADLARVRRVLSHAGFDQITARPLETAMPLGNDFDTALAHIQEFGPVARTLSVANDAEKAKALAALREAIQPYANRKPVTMAGAVWLISAKA